MKRIELTRGLYTIVDDEDYDVLNQFNWYAHNNHGRTIYAVRYKTIQGARTAFIMHRVIMNVVDSKMEVDHKNGDGLDNRRINLRVCTRFQNGHNLRLRKDNTSGIKGVVWDKSRQLWMARIVVAGKMYNLGRFERIEDAAAAYKSAAIEAFGKFANTSSEMTGIDSYAIGAPTAPANRRPNST